MNAVYIFAILDISETEAHVFKAAKSSRWHDWDRESIVLAGT